MDRQGKIKCITLLLLIKVGSNKMHQGGNYQDFLKWRGEGGGGREVRHFPMIIK